MPSNNPDSDALRRQFAEMARPVVASAHVAEMDSFVQHGSTSTLAHCVAVAWYAVRLDDALHLGCDRDALVRGGLLHDYYLYDWHDHEHCPTRWHGFVHPRLALANAERDFVLDDTERDLIAHHMFPLTPVPPRHREGWVVCLVDKACSLRETFGSYSPAVRSLGQACRVRA
jgi:uncharacterized protein